MLTHKDLVEVAYRWALNHGCGVALKELYTNCCNGEYPDVIGFCSWGESTLIECKTSRSDFLADQKKLFRKKPELGMGFKRFYCCPTDIIKINDLPQNWGLIYVNEHKKAKLIHNPYKWPNQDAFFNDRNILAEHGMMYSALRRLQIRGRVEEIYDKVGDHHEM